MKEVTASYIPMLQVVDVPSDGDGVKDQRPGIASGGGVESHEEWIFALILLFPKFCNDFPAWLCFIDFKEKRTVFLELSNSCFLGHLRILRAKTLMLGETPDDDRQPIAPDDPYQVPALEKNDEEELEDYTQEELPKDDVEEIPEVEDPNLLTREQQRALRNSQANKKKRRLIRVMVNRVKPKLQKGQVEVVVVAGAAEVEVKGRLLLLKIFRRKRQKLRVQLHPVQPVLLRQPRKRRQRSQQVMGKRARGMLNLKPNEHENHEKMQTHRKPFLQITATSQLLRPRPRPRPKTNRNPRQKQQQLETQGNKQASARRKMKKNASQSQKTKDLIWKSLSAWYSLCFSTRGLNFSRFPSSSDWI